MAKKTLPPDRDLTGRVFERLTVVSRVESDVHRNARYLCHCTCGATVVKRRDYLLKGKQPRSCGCARTSPEMKDLTGKVFGRLTVLYAYDYADDGSLKWLCQCSCGKKAVVRGYSLRKGDTRSCGCLRKELAGARSVSRRRDRERQEKLAAVGVLTPP